MSDTSSRHPSSQPQPQSQHEANDEATGSTTVQKAAAHDDDSELSDIDEGLDLDEYNPLAARIVLKEKPVEIDEDVARTLKASKRKGQAVKKPKEGRREKKKRSHDEDDDGADGEILTSKRVRNAPPQGKKKAAPEPIDEENLTPEQRRLLAIERASKREIKKPTKRRKKTDDIDLEAQLDETIADLKVKMELACTKDNEARMAMPPQAATQKLMLLPEVMSLLNRNNNQSAVVDPDSNFLQHVRFFLEPLNDGSLPAYTIQRDIFTALARLPIEKDTLLASGIGKVVLFYTKSKKPQVEIKRVAERLLSEWSRPILKRTDDYKKREIETREYDHTAAMREQNARNLSRGDRTVPVSAGMDGVVAMRERIDRMPKTYTIAPRSTFDPTRAPALGQRPIGASGQEAFRKLTQKVKKKA